MRAKVRGIRAPSISDAVHMQIIGEDLFFYFEASSTEILLLIFGWGSFCVVYDIYLSAGNNYKIILAKRFFGSWHFWRYYYV